MTAFDTAPITAADLRAAALQGVPGSVREVQSRLHGGALLIENFPVEDNAPLVALAKGFGSVIPPGRLSNHPVEDDCVYRVECRGDGLRAEDGSIVHSTAPAMFSCHTDGFGSFTPPSVVMLLCVRPDPQGGDTMLVRVRQILDCLDAADIARLRRPIYPNGLGRVALLFDMADGRIGARFNLADLQFNAERSDTVVDSACLDAAVRFAAAADHLALLSPFRLQAGDCLVLDNAVLLHGRTALPRDSRRLLKRIRIYGREASAASAVVSLAVEAETPAALAAGH
jgi:alpha-ketoglutarate-dependent taurine dioxygenase